MKRKLLFACLLFVLQTINGQDLDYNLLRVLDDGQQIFAKREINNSLWIKKQAKDIKIHLKNGKTKKVQGEVEKTHYQCDCDNNKIHNITDSTIIENFEYGSLYQLFFDYSCSDLKYDFFITEDEAQWQSFLGKIENYGKYKNIWVKTSLSPEYTSPFEDDDITLIAKDYKSGEKIKKKLKVISNKTYNISKYVIDCTNKRIAPINIFNYLERSNKIDSNFLPVYYRNIGFINIFTKSNENENDIYKHLYRLACIENK